MPSLYFDQYKRNFCIRLTRIYISGVKSRIIPNFSDYDQKAEDAREEYLHHFAASTNENIDGEAIYEVAFKHGFQTYIDEIFLKNQMIGISATGLYHLWEKLLKCFILDEAEKDRIAYTKSISKWTMDDIVSCLEIFDYKIEKTDNWLFLNRLRLVANATKHGSGSSRENLIKEWPELFHRLSNEQSFAFFDSDELQLDEGHFDQLAEAVISFWLEFPERLSYNT